MNRNSIIWDRIGAIFGILFVILSLAAFALAGGGNFPSPDDPSPVIADYLSRSQPSDLAISVKLLGVFCFFWFLAYLGRLLRSAEGERGWLAPVAYGGGLVFAALMLVETVILVGASVLSDYGTDTQVAKTLFVLGWDFIYVYTAPLAALVGATSAIILRYGALPRWLGWASLPFAGLLVIPVLAWPAVPLFFIWSALVSVVLLVRTIRIPRRQIAMQTA